MAKKAAKKPTKRQRPIKGMEDEFKVPKPVQDAADRHANAKQKKNRADEEARNSKDALMRSMRKAGVSTARILLPNGNAKLFRLSKEDKLKLEPVKRKVKKKVARK